MKFKMTAFYIITDYNKELSKWILKITTMD